METDNLIDYYRVLGVQNTATISEIHAAYWRQASHCHPDKEGGSHEKMVRLVEAWKILSEPNKRARYDQLLKFRHDGWHSRQFDDEVNEARKQAKDDAARSWPEFETIYQKAFYTFNKDFYGEEMNGKAAGPYSPVMWSKSALSRAEEAAKNQAAGNALNTTGGAMLIHIFKTFILLVAMVAAFFIYNNYNGIGRFVPLGQQDAVSKLILDTATGAVYSVEKRDGTLASSWKEAVSPVPREKKWLPWRKNP